MTNSRNPVLMKYVAHTMAQRNDAAGVGILLDSAPRYPEEGIAYVTNALQETRRPETVPVLTQALHFSRSEQVSELTAANLARIGDGAAVEALVEEMRVGKHESQRRVAWQELSHVANPAAICALYLAFRSPGLSPTDCVSVRAALDRFSQEDLVSALGREEAAKFLGH